MTYGSHQPPRKMIPNINRQAWSLRRKEKEEGFGGKINKNFEREEVKEKKIYDFLNVFILSSGCVMITWVLIS